LRDKPDIVQHAGPGDLLTLRSRKVNSEGIAAQALAVHRDPSGLPVRIERLSYGQLTRTVTIEWGSPAKAPPFPRKLIVETFVGGVEVGSRVLNQRRLFEADLSSMVFGPNTVSAESIRPSIDIVLAAQPAVPPSDPTRGWRVLLVLSLAVCVLTAALLFQRRRKRLAGSVT
jgi:hypothetical protein